MELTIWGDPVPKARPRLGRGRAYTPRRTLAAEQHLQAEWRKRYGVKVNYDKPTMLTLHAEFYCATHRRVDVDNLLKLVMDALNDVAYTDDSQIVHLIGDVYRGAGREHARTEIELTSCKHDSHYA